jgi:predicted small secreted protein
MSEHGIETSAHRPYVVWLLVVAAMVSGLAVSACNTMRGAGEDVSAAGDALSGSADDVQDEMD